jgi:hypothetical protein
VSLQESLLHEQAHAAGDSQTEKTLDEEATQKMCEDLLAQLRTDVCQAAESFRRMSFASPEASWAAQRALRTASVKEAAALAEGLRGHVRGAVQSKHANYVVQVIVEVIPVAKTRFVVEELVGFGVESALHRCSCRVLCRILEHASLDDGATENLMQELLANAEHLTSTQFGSFVMRHILEFGSTEHRRKIALAICKDDAVCRRFAKHQHASHVVERALRFCAYEEQRMIVEQLVAHRDELFQVAADQFGRHVVKNLLTLSELPPDLRRMATSALEPFAKRLGQSRYGKSVLHSLRMASSN